MLVLGCFPVSCRELNSYDTAAMTHVFLLVTSKGDAELMALVVTHLKQFAPSAGNQWSTGSEWEPHSPEQTLLRP